MPPKTDAVKLYKGRTLIGTVSHIIADADQHRRTRSGAPALRDAGPMRLSFLGQAVFKRLKALPVRTKTFTWTVQMPGATKFRFRALVGAVDHEPARKTTPCVSTLTLFIVGDLS